MWPSPATCLEYRRPGTRSIAPMRVRFAHSCGQRRSTRLLSGVWRASVPKLADKAQRMYRNETAIVYDPTLQYVTRF